MGGTHSARMMYCVELISSAFTSTGADGTAAAILPARQTHSGCAAPPKAARVGEECESQKTINEVRADPMGGQASPGSTALRAIFPFDPHRICVHFVQLVILNFPCPNISCAGFNWYQ